MQTQPATQTAETEQDAYEVVLYDDIPEPPEPTADAQLHEQAKLPIQAGQYQQPGEQTAGAEQTGGTGQIMPPAPDKQIAGTEQGCGITASLGFGGEGDSGQPSATPRTSLIPSGSIQRVSAQRKEGCFSSCTIS